MTNKPTESNEIKHLFRESNIVHPMKRRFEEFDEIDHAKTERLINSPIIVTTQPQPQPKSTSI